MEVLPQAFRAVRADAAPGQDPPLPFQRPPSEQTGGKGPATFDFLGFTLYWRRSRRGRWVTGVKTRKCAPATGHQRPSPTSADATGTSRSRSSTPGSSARLLGHFNYFGVNGNSRSLGRLLHEAYASLVQVAAAAQPARAPDLGAVQGADPAGASRCRRRGSSSRSGSSSARHPGGRAGWWKSPCPDLGRAPGAQAPGATRHNPAALRPSSDPTHCRRTYALRWTVSGCRRTRACSRRATQAGTGLCPAPARLPRG